MRVIPRVLIVLLIAACSQEPDPPLVASGLEVTRPMPGSGMSAGFLTLANNTDSPVRISEIRSDDFGRVEIHETRIENGNAKMLRLEELIVPAGGDVTLKRGGLHLMLMDPRSDDDEVSLQFFDNDLLLLELRTKRSAH